MHYDLRTEEGGEEDTLHREAVVHCNMVVEDTHIPVAVVVADVVARVIHGVALVVVVVDCAVVVE